MASLWDLSKSNLSYYTVPAAFAITMLSHTIATTAAGRNYDLANPRRTEEHCLKDESMDKTKRYMVLRAANASANGYESLGVYAAGVVAANTSGVPVFTLNVLTLGYIATRVGYTFTYVVLQKNRSMAPLRSLFWIASIVQLYTLFFKAGNLA